MSTKRGVNRSSSVTTVPRPTLVLDLDETLVHTSLIAPRSGDYFPVRAHRRQIFVQSRPGLPEFLARVQRIYDVFFFTASPLEYADPMITKIAPRVRACRRFFLDSCTPVSGYLAKDLSVLRRPLSHMLLVDDIAGSALLNPENLVRIKPWNGDPADRVLLDDLLPLLEDVAFYQGIVANARQFVMKKRNGAVSTFPLLGI
jgi:Dullard-like phosphatase family protein